MSATRNPLVMNIESLVNDDDLRHHKLLQNIVKILKINDLLEEYRAVLRTVKEQCSCNKKLRATWEQFNSIEVKYKELIVESCRNSNITNNGSLLAVPSTSNSNNTGVTINNKTNESNSKTGHHKSPSSSKGTKEQNNHQGSILQPEPERPPVSSPSAAEKKSKSSSLSSSGGKSPVKVMMCSPETSSTSFVDHHYQGRQQQPPQQLHHQQGNNGNLVVLNDGTTVNHITYMMGDEDVSLIEEEIMDDEEDDAEEELDIEEYMALTEILEKDHEQFVKEADPKDEELLVIRNTNTKEIICYECIVGGACGFLSRERQRMLYHISKHYHHQVVDDSEDEEMMVAHSSRDIDISIIPVSGESSNGVGGSGNKEGSPGKSGTGNRSKQQQPQQIVVVGDPQMFRGIPVGGMEPKPIRCSWDNCTFMCDQNYKLRTHIRQVHEKVRPYLCDWPGCFGAYKTRSNLASHRMVHTGERPFICDYPKCGAKFARKYDCERHRRIHSEKMFPCEWPGCGKRLCDPYNLERHMMVHKGELPYRCPVSNCIRGFRELRYLRDHMVNSHKFLPDTHQLRMACMNSAKLLSLAGFNLHETGSDDGSLGEMPTSPELGGGVVANSPAMGSPAASCKSPSKRTSSEMLSEPVPIEPVVVVTEMKKEPVKEENDPISLTKEDLQNLRDKAQKSSFLDRLGGITRDVPQMNMWLTQMLYPVNYGIEQSVGFIRQLKDMLNGGKTTTKMPEPLLNQAQAVLEAEDYSLDNPQSPFNISTLTLGIILVLGFFAIMLFSWKVSRSRMRTDIISGQPSIKKDKKKKMRSKKKKQKKTLLPRGIQKDHRKRRRLK